MQKNRRFIARYSFEKLILTHETGEGTKLLLKIVINNRLLPVLILLNNCKKKIVNYVIVLKIVFFFYVGSGVIFLSPRPLFYL